METIIETTCGSRTVDEQGNVIGYDTGSTDNGYCYKDDAAFESGEGVCYIAEYDFGDLQEELTDLQAQYENSDMTDEEYRKQRSEILGNHGWTRKAIIDLCGGEGFEKVAECIYYTVDWQEPSTYLQEFELTLEELPSFGLTRKQVEDAWGNDYFYEYPYPTHLVNELNEIEERALRAIDEYTGSMRVAIADGVNAIDMDDSWLIINNGKPFLRNKKDQKLIENGKTPNWEDKAIEEIWDIEVLCAFADDLTRIQENE